MTELAPPPVSHLPEAPPEPEWVTAEAALAAQVEAIEATVLEGHRAWVEAVQEGWFLPLRKQVQAAAARHQQYLDEAGLGEDQSVQQSAMAFWKQVRAYRKGVRDDVLSPLRDHLDDTQARLSVRFEETLQALGAEQEGLPETLMMAEAPDLYVSDPEEGWLRRVRKSTVRQRRRWRGGWSRLANRFRRLFRQSVQPLPPYGKAVPVKALVGYHVQVRLAGRLASDHEALLQQVAHYLSILEEALTAWTHAVLTAERRLDQAAFHAPDSLGWPAEAPAEEPVAAQDRHQLRQQVGQLQQVLEEAAELDLQWPVLEHEAVAAASEALREDLRQGGTFLLNPRTRKLPEADKQAGAQAGRDAQKWAAWYGQVVDRLQLNEHLLALRDQVLEVEDALLSRMAEVTVLPILKAFAALGAHVDEAQQQVQQAATATKAETGSLRETLEMLQAQVLHQLQEVLGTTPMLEADEVLTQPGAQEVAALQRLLPELPSHLLVHIGREDPAAPVDAEAPLRRVDLRAMMKEMLANALPDRLRARAQSLRTQVMRIWNDAEQVQHIVQYNFDAALEELAAVQDGDAAGSPAAAVQTASDLATDALERAADVLSSLANALQAPWQAFQENAFEALRKDWIDLHRRVQSEDLIEGKWAGLSIQTRRWSERALRQTRQQWQQYEQVSRRWLRIGRSRAQVLIQQGRSAVGVLEMAEEEVQRTVDAVAGAAALRKQLPLIYRKLFSFEPVGEAALLEGRGRDLQRLMHLFKRWQQGQPTSALVLSAPPGSGRTSLVRVLSAALEKEHAVVRHAPLRARFAEADAVAAYLAEALGIELSEPSTFEALEQALLEQPRPATPVVCLVDDLELLLLCVPGGAAVLERTLIFFSRTDTHIWWITTCRSFAWRFVETTARASAGLVTTIALTPLGRTELEAIVLGRHRRSGMPLQFAAPPDPSPILRQRLRRARTPEDQQAVLREEFFDRLARASGQNVMLALFYWIRMADFETIEGTLTVQPLEPLDFSFLATFGLDHAFTLKAFLLHQRLTLEQHNRIFRKSDAQSTFILESLLNTHVIEPVPEDGQENTVHVSIVTGQAYRIVPLLLQPVTEYLRARHIIY